MPSARGGSVCFRSLSRKLVGGHLGKWNGKERGEGSLTAMRGRRASVCQA